MLTGRQSKVPVGEVLTIRVSQAGSAGGSGTGEQRCAQLHPTAVNRKTHEPPNLESCTSGTYSHFPRSTNSELTS
jgi:hypothetical protein